MEWIVSGFDDLRRVIEEHKIRAVAMPALGTGNGGMDWANVRAAIERQLAGLNGVHIDVYEPAGEAAKPGR